MTQKQLYHYLSAEEPLRLVLITVLSALKLSDSISALNPIEARALSCRVRSLAEIFIANSGSNPELKKFPSIEASCPEFIITAASEEVF
jgi:hypothetical protein